MKPITEHDKQAAGSRASGQRYLSSEGELHALPELSIIGVHMPIPPSPRPRHLLAIQKDDGWFAAGSGEEISVDELVETIQTTGPAVLLWIPLQDSRDRVQDTPTMDDKEQDQ